MPFNAPETRLTPAMRDVLRRMAKAERPPFHTLTPAQARAYYRHGIRMSSRASLRHECRARGHHGGRSRIGTHHQPFTMSK